MTRKISLWGVVAIMLLGIVGCDEIIEKLGINFEIGPHIVDFNVTPRSAGDLFESYDVVLVDIKKEIEDNGGSLDKLESIKIKEATISIISGTNNFDAFEWVECWIETTGMAAKKVAWVNPVPLSVSEVVPTGITSDNLKDYLEDDQYTVILKGKLREDITETVYLSAEIYYQVKL